MVLIIFEGPDGVGKTTQIKNISKRLAELNVETLILRFPNPTTELGQRIRLAIKDSNISPMELQLLFAIERYIELENLKEVKKEKIIFFDRFYYSGQIYGELSGLDKRLLELTNVYNIEPDLIIHFDGVGHDLGNDRFSDLEFQKKINEMYNQKFRDMKNVFKVSTKLSIDATTDIICKELNKRFLYNFFSQCKPSQ